MNYKIIMSNIDLLGYSRDYIKALKVYRRIFGKGASIEGFEMYARQNGGLDNLPKVISNLLLLSALG